MEFKQLFSLLLDRHQFEDSALGQPFLKFFEPVSEGGFGGDNQERAIDVLVLSEEGDQRDRLDSLAQTHLISQNAVDADIVQIDQPVEPVKLKALELSVLQGTRLVENAGLVFVFELLFGWSVYFFASELSFLMDFFFGFL